MMNNEIDLLMMSKLNHTQSQRVWICLFDKRREERKFEKLLLRFSATFADKSEEFRSWRPGVC
jgi:hypothetical protein